MMMDQGQLLSMVSHQKSLKDKQSISKKKYFCNRIESMCYLDM
jgi:hypothetical protein